MKNIRQLLTLILLTSTTITTADYKIKTDEEYWLRAVEVHSEYNHLEVIETENYIEHRYTADSGEGISIVTPGAGIEVEHTSQATINFEFKNAVDARAAVEGYAGFSDAHEKYVRDLADGFDYRDIQSLAGVGSVSGAVPKISEVQYGAWKDAIRVAIEKEKAPVPYVPYPHGEQNNRRAYWKLVDSALSSDLEVILRMGLNTSAYALDEIQRATENKLEWKSEQIKIPEMVDYESASQYVVEITSSDPQFREQAQHIKGKLDSSTPQSPQQRYAKSAGYNFLNLANNESVEGSRETAQAALNIAGLLAEVALGLNPVTSFMQDAYALATGRSFVTGEELDSFGYAASMVGLATLGVSGGATSIAKALAKFKGYLPQRLYTKYVESGGLVKSLFETLPRGQITQDLIKSLNKYNISSKEGIATYASVHRALSTLTAPLQIERIREGKAIGKIAMIGRSMGTEKLPGVRQAAAHIEKTTGIKVEIFDGDVISAEGRRDILHWKTKKMRLSDDEMKRTNVYAENREWIRKKIVEDYTVLDIGNPHNLNRSVNYEMEVNIVFGGLK